MKNGSPTDHPLKKKNMVKGPLNSPSGGKLKYSYFAPNKLTLNNDDNCSKQFATNIIRILESLSWNEKLYSKLYKNSKNIMDVEFLQSSNLTSSNEKFYSKL